MCHFLAHAVDAFVMIDLMKHLLAGSGFSYAVQPVLT